MLKMVALDVAHLPNIGKALGLVSSIIKTKLRLDLTGFQTVGGLSYKMLTKQVWLREFKESSNSIKLSLELQMHINTCIYNYTFANHTHVHTNVTDK